MITNPQMEAQHRRVPRRTLISLGLSFAAVKAWPQCSAEKLGTPYKLGKLVLRASSQEGQFDQVSVDCPFVFRHGGHFYMTFVAFDGTGYQTGLAVSSDLINWKKKGAILRRDTSNPVLQYNIAMNWIARENGLDSPGELIRVNGHILGAYHAYPGPGYEQGAAVIGLCRSKDLLHWEVGPPVLKPEDGADWENGGLYKPCLVKDEDTYYLFYNAKNRAERNWKEQTGVALSKDLRMWERHPENPIIRNGPAGSLDEHFASDPCVLRAGTQWVFYYFGLDAKGVARDLLATGPDLVHPRKCDWIAVDVGKPGSVDSVYAHKPSLIYYRGDLYHFYCAVSQEEGHQIRGISVARSRPWS